MEEYTTPESIAKIKRTTFKKGHLPKNTKHDGYIGERKDKTGRVYLYIRIAVGKMIPLHRHIWEKHHGPIPRGHNINFVNGNTRDCRIENLEILTNKQQLEKNYHDKYPQEIKKIVQIKAVLSRQINKSIV